MNLCRSISIVVPKKAVVSKKTMSWEVCNEASCPARRARVRAGARLFAAERRATKSVAQLSHRVRLARCETRVGSAQRWWPDDCVFLLRQRDRPVDGLPQARAPRRL